MAHSPHPTVEIPDLSVFDYLFADLTEQELDLIALIDGTSGAETTYRQLVGQVSLLAGALAARGVGVGDVVGMLCPNIPAFATVF
ncbi:AMP-binding protein, partial [Rhizobium johnstonii]|uniref:AMP-binding protein n=1 Tax=Rhizobium johnstonii TaxID=3019933 RepID=UPI003F97925C